MHAPGLGELAQKLGAHCRYGTALPPRLSEFAILCTARLWRAQYEWFAHAPMAEKGGVKPKTIEDLRREELGALGYAKRLRHGEIGKGLNDYDAIFSELKRVGFDGWISIEDGVDGMDQLRRSVSYLKEKIGKYWR
jgi:hypothetical protein